MSTDDLFQAEPVCTEKSGTSKVLIGCGIGCGVALLLCFVAVIAFFFLANRYMANAFSEDPEVIARMTDDITHIEIPNGFEPTAGLNLDIPFTGESFMSMSIYSNREDDGALVIAQFSEAWSEDGNADKMAAQVRDSLAEQDESTQDMTIEESEEVELTIRDESAIFLIERGTGNDTGEEMWRVTGTCEGKGGLAFLLLQAKAENLTREQIDEMLESLE